MEKPPTQNWWQKLRDFIAPPEVLEIAKSLKQDKLQEKGKLGATKVAPKSPISRTASTQLAKVEKTPQKLSSEKKPNSLMQCKLVKVGELAPFEIRAELYIKHLASQRGQMEVEVSETGDGVLVIFSEDPFDCLLVYEPEVGAHCHPTYGTSIKMVRARLDVQWRKIAV